MEDVVLVEDWRKLRGRFITTEAWGGPDEEGNLVLHLRGELHGQSVHEDLVFAK
jgi:hypothetical protein